MARLETYCSKGFLDAFLAWREEIIWEEDLEKQAKSLRLWGQYANFIQWSELRLELDRASFKEKYLRHPVLKMIMKSGTCKPRFQINTFREMQEDADFFRKVNPKAVFLLDEKQAFHRDLQHDFGLLAGSASEWEAAANKLFHQRRQPIKRGGFSGGWSWLQRIEKAGNALVIVDPYLFQPDRAIAISNLKSLLLALLPEKLQRIPFYITILVGEKELFNLEEIHQAVIEMINSCQFSLEVSLTLLAGKYLHDRHVFSNYSWISSGYGFNIFNKKGKAIKNTDVSYYSIGVPASAQGGNLGKPVALDLERKLEEYKASMSHIDPETGELNGIKAVAGEWPCRNPLLL